ncbi:hypothetical protein JCM11251_001836 [Rhodosporidiobolus azoricus]
MPMPSSSSPPSAPPERTPLLSQPSAAPSSSTPSSASSSPPPPSSSHSARQSLRHHRLTHPSPALSPSGPTLPPSRSSTSPSGSSTPLSTGQTTPLASSSITAIHRASSRPRSIRSLASYGAVDSHTSTAPTSPDERSSSPSPSLHAPDRKPRSRLTSLRHELRSRLLCLTIALLLAVCVYASFVDDFMGDVEAAISCATCIGLLAPLKALARVGDDAFVDTFVGACEKLGIEDPDVCLGAVGSQAPILAHDLRSIQLASPAAKSFCSTVFGLCPLQRTREHTVRLEEERREVGGEEWDAVVALRGRGEGAEGEKGKRSVRRKWESKGREPFKVVHISDVHVDRSYVEGATTDCTKVICCRNYGPEYVGEGVKSPAGKYGHKKCDTPPALVESMFGAIERFAPERAFTIFTGDVVESAVWAVDEENVTSDLHLWYEDLRMKNLSASIPPPPSSLSSDGLFVQQRSSRNGRGRKAPSYPVIGNHDIAPVNAFPRSPTNSSTTDSTSAQWVFSLSAASWQRWIGRAAARQVREKSGCYSVVHPGTRLKVVSLNTNYWYKQNFWLYDSDLPPWDPNGILTWLAEELDQAEREGLRVWIIGHMPPGKVDSLRDQSNYLSQIFQRYHSTIAAHFYGHSHVDEFEIGYEDYNNRTEEGANGVAFIGGAVTPTSGNPVFRVYDIDPDTYEVMDFTPYYANKTSPTFQSSPQWEPYYSARSAYAPYLAMKEHGGEVRGPWPEEKSLGPGFWHRVTEVFEKNETAFQLFNTRLSRGGKIEDCSGPLCRKNTICMLRSMRSEDNCAVIQPGLSFKDQKRDTDAVTEPQRDEERDDDYLAFSSSSTSRAPPHRISALHTPDHPEERFSQSRQHDFFACEGPGLGSMLRKLGSGIGVPTRRVRVAESGQVREEWESGEADFSALRFFQTEVHAAVKRHRHGNKKRSRFSPLRIFSSSG